MIYLEHKGNRIASFKVFESDQPWHICEFSPLERFSEHEEFFKAFQKEYQSREVGNFDEHFGKLVANNYKLVSGSRESVRFTLLFEEAHVRLRAHFVQNT